MDDESLTFGELRLANLLMNTNTNTNTNVSLAPMVHVTANDYAYDGWLVALFQKQDNAWRCVVEDANKRLFVHNMNQLEFAPDLSQALADMVIRIDRFAAGRNINLAAAVRTRFEPEGVRGRKSVT